MYVVDMTNDTNPNNIPETPHVVAFVRADGRLRAVAGSTDLSEEFAIYPNRHAANSAIGSGRYQSDGTVLFSVPAAALFTVKTVEVFALRPRG